MAKYTKEQVMQMVRENNVLFIRLQFTDILGSLKNVAITDKQLEKALKVKVRILPQNGEEMLRELIR